MSGASLAFLPTTSGFDPERYRGKAVVTTMHKAKGLEWDRVYLMSVNNYDFPFQYAERPLHLGESGSFAAA